MDSKPPRAGNRYLTIAIDLHDTPCLVVGGGPVGTRKTRKLLAHGAQVVVVSPKSTPELTALAERKEIAWIPQAYDPKHLDGCRLAVAATPDDKLNLQIREDAEARGVLACLASPGEQSNVIFPALWEEAGLAIAVHTDGHDCVRATHVRDQIGVWMKNTAAAAHVQPFLDSARLDKHALLKLAQWHSACGALPGPPATVKVGIRGSRLSLDQTDEVLELLRILAPQTRFDVQTVETPGDRDKTTPLPSVTEDDFFTRDLDDALEQGVVDLAVHSTKDLPQQLRPGLHAAAITPSWAPWDCLASREGRTLGELPPGARVGTSSERRRENLLRLRPDLRPAEIRGNVPNRIQQMDCGDYDALILAAVGLIRLGMTDRISEIFPLDRFPVMPGQGSLALLVRTDDQPLRNLCAPLDIGTRKGLPWAQAKSI